MKKTILLLALVAGGGYYLHWYTFTTETVGNSEHVDVVIDKNKIKQDEEQAVEKLRGVQGQAEGQLLEDARQRVSPAAGAANAPPAVQVVEQPNGYAPRNSYPPQGAYEQRGGYAPQSPYPPQQDPYGEPQSYSPPPPRQPARTAAQDLDRGFQ
ncbi:MAG TPA: hypothetical protein VMV10_05665 [Pirellulales bacterium]|nr:hypothetical protein [Pirellulales bacterium]